METTKHATATKYQGDIPDCALEIIKDGGRVICVKDLDFEIFFEKKESNQIVNNLKKIITQIERASGTTIIVCDNKILTTYRCD